jgi:hypothetical protein
LSVRLSQKGRAANVSEGEYNHENVLNQLMELELTVWCVAKRRLSIIVELVEFVEEIVYDLVLLVSRYLRGDEAKVSAERKHVPVAHALQDENGI